MHVKAMRGLLRLQNIGLVFIATAILLLSPLLGVVQTVYASAPKLNVNPSSLTVSEGSNREVTLTLPEPIVTPTPDSGYVQVHLTSSDPSRLNVGPDYQYWSWDEWNQARTIMVMPVDDKLANGDVSATISYEIASDSEFYDGYSGDIAVNITDNDTPPEITAPKAGQNVPAGSLAVTGTAAADSEITVEVDGDEVGTTTADENGDWDIMIDWVDAGSHNVVAKTKTSNHYAYMANAYSGSIDVINVDTQNYAGEIPDSGSEGATYNTYNDTVYSASNVDGKCRIVAYDPVSLEEKAVMSSGNDCNAISLTLSANGHTGYMLYEDDGGSDRLAVADLTSNAYLEDHSLSNLGGQWPSGITISPDGSKLWVRHVEGVNIYLTSDWGLDDQIELVDGGSAYRQNIVFSSDGETAYTGDSEEGVVFAIDTDTLNFDEINVDDGVNMLALSPDGEKLFASASYPSSSICVINTNTNNLIDCEGVDENLPPESIAITDDGQWVVGDDHGSGAIFFGKVSGNADVDHTIFAPSGGSYYTSTDRFTSPSLTSVLGVSTTTDFSATAYQSPNTGLGQ